MRKFLFHRLSIIAYLIAAYSLAHSLLPVKYKIDDEIDFAAFANIDVDDELTMLAPASCLELSAEEASRHEILSPAGQHLSMAFGDDATLSGPSSSAGT